MLPCRRMPAARLRAEVGQMRADIVPGAPFPDYELPDHTGREAQAVRVARRRADDRLPLAGLLLPEGPAQAMNLVAFEPELKVGYAKLVTISTDDLLATTRTGTAGRALALPLRSRPHVQKDLDIQEYTDPCTIRCAAHVGAAPELRVHGIYNGYWYWGRPSIEELRRDLRE